MPSTLTVDSISLSAFQTILSRYVGLVPTRLHDLDELRYSTIPASLAARREKSRDADDAGHLTKDEVEKLVEWKLKHGTYRPRLAALVASNPPAAITAATTTAFSLLHAGTSPPACLPPLTALKGIGPATASLLLSVADPGGAPFFADELFRYATWEAERGRAGGEKGWGRGIKYSKGEYEVLCGRVEGVKERLEVKAVDLERVAYVLGREGRDLLEEVEELGNAEEGAVSGEVSGKVEEKRGKVVREAENEKVEKDEKASESRDESGTVRRSKRRAAAAQETDTSLEKKRSRRRA